MKRKLLFFALSFAFALSGCNHQEVKSIENIVKTNTVDLTDYYTIYYSDGTTYDFVITNGKDGINGLQGKDGHTPKIEISKKQHLDHRWRGFEHQSTNGSCHSDYRRKRKLVHQ